MSKIFLLKGSIVTALADSKTDLFSALLEGKSRFKEIGRFDTSKLAFHKAACIDFLEKEQKETENLTQTLLRKILPEFTSLPSLSTIIWSGVKGNAEFIEQEAWSSKPVCSYPYLPRHYSHWIRDELGYKNTALLDVGAACASSAVGVSLGADLILSGRSRSVLVVAADIVSYFVMTGFSSLMALSRSECRPFDVNRDGLLLGDGAVALLMADEEYTEELGLTPLAQIAGWGVTNDATHITAPAIDGRGLTAAINQACKIADIKPKDIGAFCAHGTGTIHNDAMELTAIEKVFRKDRQFPVFSIKGAIGHTLGAAGGIEVLISARALDEGVVPPTIGLQCPEPKAMGRISSKKKNFNNNYILTGNSGFGGVNTALILKKYES